MAELIVTKLIQSENIIKMDYKNFVPHGLQSALQQAHGMYNPSLSKSFVSSSWSV
jgi:hypothetical protein